MLSISICIELKGVKHKTTYFFCGAGASIGGSRRWLVSAVDGANGWPAANHSHHPQHSPTNAFYDCITIFCGQISRDLMQEVAASISNGADRIKGNVVNNPPIQTWKVKRQLIVYDFKLI